MAEHPVNLALRFGLEMAALVSLGIWGWSAQSGVLRWVFVAGAPVLAAALWGIFRVTELHSRQTPPVHVAGWIRLLLEAIIFAAAVAGLWSAGQHTPAFLLGVLVIFHYALSYDRVARLLKG